MRINNVENILLIPHIGSNAAERRRTMADAIGDGVHMISSREDHHERIPEQADPRIPDQEGSVW